MVTLNIPQGLVKNGFVVLPREEYREYEDFLRTKKQQSNNDDIVVKRDKSFKVPKRHEKFYDELDKELTESLREVQSGKVSSTFSTIEEGIRFLNSRKKFIQNET